MKDFFLLVFLIISIYLIKVWFQVFFKRKEYDYTKKEYIMTQSERDCFNSLVRVVGESYWIFPQIHFSAFLNNKIVGQNWKGAFFHINGKSVDFLLCTKDRLSPKLAIELDDPSHERQDRQSRDFEEERIFENAHMPLLRLDHKDIDNVENLKRKIVEALLPKTPEPKKLTWYQEFVS